MDDRDLLALYEARNEAALEETDGIYGTALKRLASRFLQNESDVEECVNDTYLKIWDAIPPAKPDCLRAYLFQVCRRTALSRLEHDGAQKRSANVVALTDELACCLPDPAADGDFAAQELGQLLNRFVGSLPPQQRILFLRRYWYGDSIEEIAKHCRCSISKVKTSLHRSRQKLRIMLESEGFSV